MAVLFAKLISVLSWMLSHLADNTCSMYCLVALRMCLPGD